MTKNTEKIVVTATKDQLPNIVSIHKAAFPGFFMTELGHLFLKLYYKLVIKYANGILLIAQEDDNIIGFAAGFLKPQEFNDLLKKNKFLIGITIFPILLFKPWLIYRLLRNAKKITNRLPENGLIQSELASLAVHPEHSGNGYGKALVKKFITISKQLGAQDIYLTTDAENNKAVNQFYQDLGFQLSRRFNSTPGRIINEYHFFMYTGNQGKANNSQKCLQ